MYCCLAYLVVKQVERIQYMIYNGVHIKLIQGPCWVLYRTGAWSFLTIDVGFKTGGLVRKSHFPHYLSILWSFAIFDPCQDGCLAPAPVVKSQWVPRYLWHLYQQGHWVIFFKGQQNASLSTKSCKCQGAPLE